MGSDAVTAATAAVTAAAAAPGDAVSAASAALPQTGAALVLAKIAWFIVVPGFYLALAFSIVALVLRLSAIFRAGPPPFQLAIYPERKSPTLAALGDALGMPQIRRKNPLFWVFLLVFHVGLVLLVLGHLDILPEINIVPASSRHMLGAGAVGLMVTVPVFYFFGRRFRSPVREISNPGDYLLLLLLLFTFLLGDLMSWGNSWTSTGFVMTKADFARYFDGLLKFKFEDPRAYLHGTHYHFLVLHLLLAEAVLAVLPFSKIVHAFLTVPVNALRRRVRKTTEKGATR